MKLNEYILFDYKDNINTYNTNVYNKNKYVQSDEHICTNLSLDRMNKWLLDIYGHTVINNCIVPMCYCTQT